MSSSLDHDDGQAATRCESSDDHGADSDSQNLGFRPDQAERKRQLERNRRNLINTRFAELSAELQRSENASGNGNLLDGHRVKRPRLDKEALLKEATTRLIVQDKELSSVTARLRDLLAQIDAMRVEMDDLRKDKSYLRSEVNRLRISNTNLWKVVHRAPSPALSTVRDNSKIPLNGLDVSRRADSARKRAISNSETDSAICTTNVYPPLSHENASLLKTPVQPTGLGLQRGMALPNLQSSQRVGVDLSKYEDRMRCPGTSLSMDDVEKDSSMLFSSMDDFGVLFPNTTLPQTSRPISGAVPTLPESTNIGLRTTFPNAVPVSAAVSLPQNCQSGYGGANGRMIG